MSDHKEHFHSGEEGEFKHFGDVIKTTLSGFMQRFDEAQKNSISAIPAKNQAKILKTNAKGTNQSPEQP